MTDGNAAGNMMIPADLQWVQAEGLPSVEIMYAALAGNTSEPGPFTVRFRFPPGLAVSRHRNSMDAYVTVLSGALHLCIGEDPKAAPERTLPAGGFAVIPAHTAHHGWAEGETVIQMHGTGPCVISYVDPAEDPRPRP